MTDQATAAIEAMTQKLAEAFENHDFAAVGEMHTNDAVMLAPGTNIIIGKGNIQSFWEQKAQELRNARFATLNIRLVGDSAAVEVGTLRLRMDAPGTPLETDARPQSRSVSAKYVFVWQKIEGDWKLSTSAWNKIGAAQGARLSRGGSGMGGRMGGGMGGRMGGRDDRTTNRGAASYESR